MTATGFDQRRVFAAACLGMLLFGVTLTTVGAVLPPLIARYGLTKAEAAPLPALMSLGILAGSLIFGPVVDRFGYRPVLVAGAIGVGMGLAAIAWGMRPRALSLAMLLFGCGGGLLNGATNALVADITPDGRESGLALLGVFFGIGAFGVPLILGFLLRWATYMAIAGGLGLLVAVPLCWFVVLPFPPPKQAQGFPVRRAGALLGDASLLLVGLMLFFQSGMEMTLGGWSAEYVHEVLKLSEGSSILVLSLFWVGMVAARVLLAWRLRLWAPGSVLPSFLLLALAGAGLLLAVQNVTAAGAGLFLLGAGLAAGFPILLGFVGGRYRDLTGTAFSLVFLMALLGGGTLSYLTGVLGDQVGLRSSLGIVPVAVLAQAGLFLLLRRRLRPIAAVELIGGR